MGQGLLPVVSQRTKCTRSCRVWAKELRKSEQSSVGFVMKTWGRRAAWENVGGNESAAAEARSAQQNHSSTAGQEAGQKD